MVDERRRVGGRVHAKAVHISSYPQCRRWFGQLAQTKTVSGTVKEVKSLHNGKRGSTRLKVDWEMPGRTICKELALRNVRSGEAPALSSQITHHMQLQILK